MSAGATFPRTARPRLAWPQGFGRLGAGEGSLYGPPLIVSWLALLTVVLVALFILYMAFIPDLPTQPGFTFAHWGEVIRPFVLTTVLPNTLTLAAVTLVVSAIFGLPLCWLLNATTLPGRRLLVTILSAQIAIPGFVTAMGWDILVNPTNGLLNQAVAAVLRQSKVPLDVANPAGMGFVLGLMFTPSVVLMMSGPARSLSGVLMEAAAMSGANLWARIRFVVLPLLWPAVLGTFIYTAMTSLAIFEIPSLLGGTSGKNAVLATELFYAANPPSGTSSPDYGAAAVYGVIISCFGFVGIWLYYRVIRNAARYATIGAGNRVGQLTDLGGAGKIIGLAIVALYLLLGSVLPVFMLIWYSILPYYQAPSIAALSSVTLRNYQGILTSIGGFQPIVNTVVLIVSVSILEMFFSIATSWSVIRFRGRLAGVMDFIAMLPHALPHAAIAFSVLMLGFVTVNWLHLPGTLVIVIMTQTICFLAGGTRMMNAALIQVRSDLEEAGRMSGAGTNRILWRITLPLVKESLIFGLLWTALLSGREVTVALFLSGTSNTVMSVAVWRLWQGGLPSYATSGAVLLVVVMGIIAFLAMAVGGRAGAGQARGV